MAESVLILGPSGSGKSHSLKFLDPKKTFLINVYGKSLPFKGWRSKYFTEGKFVNMVQTDNVSSIIKSLDYAEKNGFAMAVVDDYQFVAGMKMIRDAKIKGYDKFTDIAQGFVAVTDYVKSMKSKIVVVFLSHTEDDGFGGTKASSSTLYV
jgi:energy-coupling factor transporter ATP-binding protein EcfA2